VKNIEPHILAVDSSTSVMRVGLSLPGGRVAALESRDRYRHAEFIFDLIDRLLTGNGCDRSGIKALIIGTGPGSFTGLRVGMAALKGLALAMSIPLTGVSNFEAAAGRLFEKYGPAAVVIPSRRSEYYLGHIDNPDASGLTVDIVGTDQLPARTENRQILVVDGIRPDIERLDGLLSADDFEIAIDDFIRVGQDRLAATGGNDISDLEPLYIQNFPAGG